MSRADAETRFGPFYLGERGGMGEGQEAGAKAVTGRGGAARAGGTAAAKPHSAGKAAAGRKAAAGKKAAGKTGQASRPNKRQMRLFLDELAETSNITASARAAGLASNSFYRERRRNADFAAEWHEALCEGFVRLETELLSEALVQPSALVKDATLKARAQKYRLGLALLAAHRAAVRGAGRREAGAGAGAAKDMAAGQARQKLGEKLRNVQERAQIGDVVPVSVRDLDEAEDDGGAFGL